MAYLNTPQGEQLQDVWDSGKLEWSWEYDPDFDPGTIRALVVISKNLPPDEAEDWVTSIQFDCMPGDEQDDCILRGGFADFITNIGSWPYGGPSVNSFEPSIPYYWGIMTWIDGDSLEEEGTWENSGDEQFLEFILPLPAGQDVSDETSEEDTQETEPEQTTQEIAREREKAEARQESLTKKTPSKRSSGLGGSTGSLSNDIKLAIIKNALGETDVDGYAEEIADAIANFMLRQENRVCEINVPTGVKHIKTSTSIDVNVTPETLAGPYAPLLKGIKKIASMIPGAGGIIGGIEAAIMHAASKVSEAGAKLPALDIEDGKQGGSLDVEGETKYKTQFKGRKTADSHARKSVVKLFEEEIKGL